MVTSLHPQGKILQTTVTVTVVLKMSGSMTGVVVKPCAIN